VVLADVCEQADQVPDGGDGMGVVAASMEGRQGLGVGVEGRRDLARPGVLDRQ
jgi:hypothetical protein